MIDAMAGGALPVSAALFYTVVVNALSGKITTIDCRLTKAGEAGTASPALVR
jgi:hypothetical protein